MNRPEIVEDEHLEFLDNLRDSGGINMFGVRPYIEAAFDIPTEEAREICNYWMLSFGNPDR